MLKNEKILTLNEAKQIQPLVLAMIGDAVQTLYVREFVAKELKVKVNKMTKLVSSAVNAKSQCELFKQIESQLLEDEVDITRRARNSNIHTKAKNFSYFEYIHATALEALFGYLYLTGQNERLNKFLKLTIETIKN